MNILGNAVEWIGGEGAMAQVNLLDKIKINTLSYVLSVTYIIHTNNKSHIS